MGTRVILVDPFDRVRAGGTRDLARGTVMPALDRRGIAGKRRDRHPARRRRAHPDVPEDLLQDRARRAREGEP